MSLQDKVGGASSSLGSMREQDAPATLNVPATLMKKITL